MIGLTQEVQHNYGGKSQGGQQLKRVYQLNKL